MAKKDDDNASKHRERFGDIAAEPGKALRPIEGYEKMPIVSLEEAVKPLNDLVHEVKEYALKAKAKCQKPPADGLTVDESASIRLYTMEWQPHEKCLYVVLNAKLRSEDRNSLKPWFLYLKLLITSLLKMPSSHLNLYRGLKLNLSKQYSSKKKIVWWGFSSCTITAGVLENEMFFGKTGERTLFTIDCHSAKDIRSHSSFPKEDELLLLPGTEFEITACLDSGDELHIIQLKETNTTVFLPGRVTLAKPELTTTTPPEPVPVPIVPGQNYRNSKLEHRIGGYQPRSEIELDNRQLSVNDMSIVGEQAIEEKRCTKLSLRNNYITPDGASILAKAVRNSTTMEELDLGNNRLTDRGVALLADALSDNDTCREEQLICCWFSKMKDLDKAPVKILDLSNNGIGNEGVIHLKDVIINKRTITELRLNNNEIGDEGVKALAKALKSPQANLKKLYLNNNKFITDVGADYLIDMLQRNQSLETLWLTDCSLSDSGQRRLRKAVTSKRKFSLYVENSD